MAKDQLVVDESIALKGIMRQFVEENIEHFKHVYRNFSKIIFVVDREQKKPLEILIVSGILRRLFPNQVYMIIGGDGFNDIPHRQKLKEMFHVLSHIPDSFGGYLKDHDIEAFVGEAKMFKKEDKRMYVVHGAYGEPDEEGISRPKGAGFIEKTT